MHLSDANAVSSKFDCNVSFCKTIYFVTLVFFFFSVILIYPHSLFSYFTIIMLSVMTAVTFPLLPPRLAFAVCGWRRQNDVHEIKYSVCVCAVFIHSFSHMVGLNKGALGCSTCSRPIIFDLYLCVIWPPEWAEVFMWLPWIVLYLSGSSI